MGRISENATPENIGPVAVSLADRSLDACWTNLRDVREYVEEKLVDEGFEVTQAGGASYSLGVAVLASRRPALFGQGPCQGLVNIYMGASVLAPNEIRADLFAGRLRGNFTVAEFSGIIPEVDNVDEIVTSYVSLFFEAYRERVGQN